MKTFTFRAWIGGDYNNEIKQGFTRDDGESYNCIRIGNVGISWGIDRD